MSQFQAPKISKSSVACAFEFPILVNAGGGRGGLNFTAIVGPGALGVLGALGVSDSLFPIPGVPQLYHVWQSV